jgi:hypothetical protein
LTKNRERQRGQHEEAGADRCQLCEERHSASGAERRLAAAAAERARHVAALSLLEEDDEQQERADDDVDRGDDVVEHGL